MTLPGIDDLLRRTGPGTQQLAPLLRGQEPRRLPHRLDEGEPLVAAESLDFPSLGFDLPGIGAV